MAFIDREVELNNSNSTQIEYVSHFIIKKPNWIEYLLIVWVFAFVFDEIYQVIKNLKFYLMTIFSNWIFKFFARTTDIKDYKTKLSNYFKDKWNFIDVFGALFFFIGITLWFVSIKTSEAYFDAARFIDTEF